MEESDNIIFPILKEVGCDLPPTITSIKGLIDEYVYQIASGCLQAINPELSVDIPKKFPTSKATKFRVATEVARIIKLIGYTSEIGYQSILYPHEQEVRKIIGFLIGRLPKKESNQIELDGSSGSNVQLRAQQTLQQINPLNNYTIFHKSRQQPPMIPFNSVSLVPSSNLNQTGIQISTQIRDQIANRPLFINNQTIQANYWGSYQPRLQMSTITTENIQNSHLIPAVIQYNSLEKSTENRQEECLLPETIALKLKIQSQLQINISASFKTALTEAKVAKSIYEIEKLKKIKNSSSNFLDNENVFSRKAQFAQENAVALASTEPIISAEEQLAQDKAEYEILVKEREDELSKLHEIFEKLTKKYQNLLLNIENYDNNNKNMILNQTILDDEITNLESTLKTRGHVIDFLPNAQENINKLQDLTEINMKKILTLNSTWDTVRLSMIEQHRELQNEYNKKREEFSQNLLKLQNIRAQIKQCGQDIRSKEDQYTFALQEYDTMPKNINRNVYIKRIMDIVKNIDKQNEEIGSILLDIKSVQREITNKGESVKRSFTETDDLIYNTAKAKKSSIAVDIYKDVVGLRDGFNTVISTVELIGKKQNIIRELEQSIEIIQDRGTMNNFDQVMGDLAAVQSENNEFKKKIKSHTNANGNTSTTGSTGSTGDDGKKKSKKSNSGKK